MALVGTDPRAGRYARDRYRRGLRSWRARTSKYALLFFGPFILIGLAGLAVGGHPLTWVAGGFFGMGAGAWMTFRESPPAYLENWQTGAEGERKTARRLRRLDSARWFVVHDIENGRGNYDHVLISPAGVFLLDSKYLLGDTYLRDGELRLRRRHDPESDRPLPSVRRGALAGAARLHEQLRELTGERTWVQAVVVLWCPFEPAVHEDQRIVLLSASQLIDWLERRPKRLAPHVVDRHRAAVEQLAARGSSGRARRASVPSVTRAGAVSARGCDRAGIAPLP